MEDGRINEFVNIVAGLQADVEVLKAKLDRTQRIAVPRSISFFYVFITISTVLSLAIAIRSERHQEKILQSVWAINEKFEPIESITPFYDEEAIRVSD